MILSDKALDDIEIENQIGEDTAVAVTVDTENMAFFYEMMSKNMYSDSYASIARELTSNCFDAHKENGSLEPVIVEGVYKENDYFLRFIDKGVGISPSRWKDTFRKYLSSTKRTSNDYLGAFGLGSKSPFAYCDLYYITTVYDGIEYQYTMEKSPEGIPKGDLLLEKATDKPNGTTVEFPIGNRFGSDYDKFKKAIINQLTYFDNVYIKGFDINNNYQIYEGKTFKYRLDIGQYEEMHIVLGKVKYPIDWSKVGRKEIKCPVGVKFNIGELMVTPNRENLRYTEETIEALKKGIDKAIVELRQYIDQGFDTIQEYWQAEKQEGTIWLRIKEGVKIPLQPGYYGSDSKGNTIRFPFAIPKPYLTFLGKDNPIKIPKNPFFIFNVKSTLSKGRIFVKDRDLSKNLWEYANNDYKAKLYRTSKFVNDKYKNFAIQEGYIVKKAKLSYLEIAKELGLMQADKKPKLPKGLYLEVEEPIEGNYLIETYIEHEKQQKISKSTPVIGKWGNRLSLVKQYVKEITKIFVSLTESYDKYELSAYQMQQYDDEMRSRKVIRLKNKEDLYAADVLAGVSVKETYTSEVLENDFHIIVYGDNSQKDALVSMASLLSIKATKSHYVNKKGYKYTVKVLMVNKSDLKRMKELENSFNLEEFIIGKNEQKNRNSLFIKEATRLVIHPIFKDIKLSSLACKLSKPLNDLYSTLLTNYISNYDVERLKSTKLGNELINVIIENKLYDKDKVEEAEKLLQTSKDLRIFNFIKDEVKDNSNRITDKLTFEDERKLSKLMITCGHIPDKEYVTVLIKEEEEWIEKYHKLADYVIKQWHERNSYNTFKYNLILKALEKTAWKNYPQSQKQNKLAKITMSYLEKKLSQLQVQKKS